MGHLAAKLKRQIAHANLVFGPPNPPPPPPVYHQTRAAPPVLCADADQSSHRHTHRGVDPFDCLFPVPLALTGGGGSSQPDMKHDGAELEMCQRAPATSARTGGAGGRGAARSFTGTKLRACVRHRPPVGDTIPTRVCARHAAGKASFLGPRVRQSSHSHPYHRQIDWAPISPSSTPSPKALDPQKNCAPKMGHAPRSQFSPVH